METNMLENQNVRLTVSFIIGILVGLGGYWFIAHQNNSNDAAMMANEQSATSTVESATTGNSVVVENQTPGASVTISKITLEKPGWVAIHDDINGQPGRILGAYLFDKGTHNGVVPLLRKTVEGKEYFAMIHSDDGDYHNFNPKTDTAWNVDGKPIMVKFTASQNQKNPESTTTSATSYINL